MEGIDAALAALAQKFAQVAEIKGGTAFWYFNIPPTVVQSIACCVRANVPEAALTIIERVLEQHPEKEGYVSEAVFMICVCLPKMLSQLQRAPTDPAYAALYTRLYTFWVDVKMGPLRSTPNLDASVAALVERISKWEKECDCYTCDDELRPFVRGWKGEYVFTDIDGKACKHIQQHVEKYFSRQVYCERTTGSQKGLKVCLRSKSTCCASASPFSHTTMRDSTGHEARVVSGIVKVADLEGGGEHVPEQPH